MNIAVWLTDENIESWNFEKRHRERLQEALPGVSVTVCGESAEFVDALPDANIVLVWVFKEEWIERAKNLEWIVTPAAGRDYFDVRPRPGLDIDYCTFHGEIMAETVIGMMLAHCRGIVDTVRLQKKKTWPRVELAATMKPLRGSRLTILGFGHIGEWIGKLAKPFGVHVTGVKRSPTPLPDGFDPEDRVVLVDAVDSVLPQTDFLVLSLPRAEDTNHIVNRHRLGLLPSHAVVINVGRGNAIDETALAESLSQGTIAAAYLDVYEEEPLPEDSPLRDYPNAFLMPHASAVSPNYFDLFVEEFICRFRERYT